MAIFFATLAACALLLIEHLIRRVRGKPWNPLVAYVQGVAALILPLSGLLLYWGDCRALGALLLICGCGGATVGLCYAAFDWRDARRDLHAEREINKVLRS